MAAKTLHYLGERLHCIGGGVGEYEGSGRGVIKNSPFDLGAVVVPPVDGVYAPHYGGIAVFGGGKHGLLCEIARGRRVENGLYAGYFPQDGIIMGNKLF